jgi:hypothetical protein
VDPGERMLLWCDGGPSRSRLERFPPPLEVDVDGGMYVLVDDGPAEHWHYQFIAETWLRAEPEHQQPGGTS